MAVDILLLDVVNEEVVCFGAGVDIPKFSRQLGRCNPIHTSSRNEQSGFGRFLDEYVKSLKLNTQSNHNIYPYFNPLPI